MYYARLHVDYLRLFWNAYDLQMSSRLHGDYQGLQVYYLGIYWIIWLFQSTSWLRQITSDYKGITWDYRITSGLPRIKLNDLNYTRLPFRITKWSSGLPKLFFPRSRSVKKMYFELYSKFNSLKSQPGKILFLTWKPGNSQKKILKFKWPPCSIF